MTERSRALHSPASRLPHSWESEPSPANDIRASAKSIAQRTKLSERAMLAIFLPQGGKMLDDAFDEFEIKVNMFLADHPDRANELTDDRLHANGGIDLPKTGKPREVKKEAPQRSINQGRRQ